jgi:glycosyltransferase involved in cell wall biosynthesis
MTKKTLIRITTVPLSLDKLLEGQLHFMNEYYKVIAISSDKNYLGKIGEKEQVETFHLEMTRQITPIKDIISVVKLFFFLRKTKPFIVHSHTPKAGIVGMLASKLAGIPHRLHTVAGLPLLEAKGIKRKVLNFVEKFTYSCATKVYPNSFAMQEIIIENNFCKKNKLHVIANGSTNGINVDYFNPNLFSEIQKNELREKLKISNGDFVYIFVGRIVADKGINELITAFDSISKTNTNVKLLLVGDFEDELDPVFPETKSIINSNKNCIAVGYQNDVRPYFAIANCLVFPSYREGFPNVVMQAGAMNLPAIVSNINGCNEIIINNKNGIIILPKNEDKLYKAMCLLYSDEQLRDNLILQSRELIVSRYNQKIVWQSILNEYKQLENN